ncbi:hypothetical protein A2U01_0061266, partial [Trifolium medium]|nr:hypothetical protein [Trifolium medium]
ISARWLRRRKTGRRGGWPSENMNTAGVLVVLHEQHE